MTIGFGLTAPMPGCDVTAMFLEALPAELTDAGATLRLMTVDDWPVEVALSAEPDVVRWTRYPAGLDEAGA